MLSPGIVAVGALVGAAVAPSAAAVEAAEAVLDHAVTDRRLLAAIRDSLLQALQSEAPQGVRLLPDPDPTAENAHRAQAAWAREGLRNVLEVQGPWITLTKSGCAGSINPALRLSVSLRARVIRTADGEVLYSSFAEYRGEARTFTAWAANDAQPLREAVDRAADALAQQIVTRLFGLTAPYTERRRRHDHRTCTALVTSAFLGYPHLPMDHNLPKAIESRWGHSGLWKLAGWYGGQS